MTAQVIANDRLTFTESPSDAAVMAAVRAGIQHVIYHPQGKPDLRPDPG